MLDERYTTLLKSHKDISLKECVWLDAIQKNRVITDDAVKHLKSKKLIEGRKPNYIIAAHIAQQTHQLAEYTRKKGVEEETVKQMILQLLRNANGGQIKLQDIMQTVDNMLPTILTPVQRQRKVRHLLNKMQKEGLIRSEDKKWYLS
jgi:ATP-dependent DNA helicase RecG